MKPDKIAAKIVCSTCLMEGLFFLFTNLFVEKGWWSSISITAVKNGTSPSTTGRIILIPANLVLIIVSTLFLTQMDKWTRSGK